MRGLAAVTALVAAAAPAPALAATFQVTVDTDVPFYYGATLDQLDPALGTLVRLDLTVSGSATASFADYGTAPPGDQPATGTFLFGGAAVPLSGTATVDGLPGALQVTSTGAGDATVTDPGLLAGFVGFDLFGASYQIAPQNNGYAGALDLRPAGTGHAHAVFTFDDGAPAVPEPATWLMLAAGFGLGGGALRRKRRRASA